MCFKCLQAAYLIVMGVLCTFISATLSADVYYGLAMLFCSM